ncbi:MAG: TIGR00725 family protein [Methanomassiliicoccales archaeon]
MRRRMVSVIGDSGLDESDPRYSIARELGRSLIDQGYRVVTGGLGGCMEGVCRGCKESPKAREGDIIGILPGYDPGEANPHVDVPIATGIYHARNVIVANSDAVIAIGGGSGTLSEMAMAWIMRRLIIAFRVEGWSGEMADRRIDQRVRYPDLPDDRVYGVDTVKEAMEYLELLPRYHRRAVEFPGGS